MILVFKVLAVMFMIIGIFATFTLLAIAIQGRIERKKQIHEAAEKINAVLDDGYQSVADNLELHDQQLDILSKSLEEHLREKYGISKIRPADEYCGHMLECRGCIYEPRFVENPAYGNDCILVCLKCKRSYVKGSECYEEYPDRYIAEEVSGDELH